MAAPLPEPQNIFRGPFRPRSASPVRSTWMPSAGEPDTDSEESLVQPIPVERDSTTSSFDARCSHLGPGWDAAECLRYELAQHQLINVEREGRLAAEARCAYLAQLLSREKEDKVESLRAKDDELNARVDAESAKRMVPLLGQIQRTLFSHEETKGRLSLAQAEISRLRAEYAREQLASANIQQQLRAELAEAARFRDAALLKAHRASQESAELLTKVQALESELAQLRPGMAYQRTSSKSTPNTGTAHDDPPHPPPPRPGTAFNAYEHYWELMHSTVAADVLWRFSFDTFPWPMHANEHVSQNSISRFLRLDAQQDAAKKRQIVRRQLARWHPDKFAQCCAIEFILERDRERVTEQQIAVVRHLTDILEKL